MSHPGKLPKILPLISETKSFAPSDLLIPMEVTRTTCFLQDKHCSVHASLTRYLLHLYSTAMIFSNLLDASKTSCYSRLKIHDTFFLFISKEQSYPHTYKQTCIAQNKLLNTFHNTLSSLFSSSNLSLPTE